MKRKMGIELRRWKDRENRKPFILKGVRRSGKTWLLRNFGEEYFSDTAYFNFEGNARLRRLFETEHDVGSILSSLMFMRGKTITPGETLIIFDEIQFCDQALARLKDFYEVVPAYHVVCAASFFGEDFGQTLLTPGTVEIFTLRPMSFFEFLTECGGDELGEYLRKLDPLVKIPKPFIDKLERLYRTYSITGGMPEAVDIWVKTGDVAKLDEVQQEILDAYELDFAKYAPRSEFSKLSAVWNSIPAQLSEKNSKFMFGHAKKGMRAKDLAGVLEWMIGAGLAYKVFRVESPTLPVSAYTDNNYFKVYMSDTGLLRKISDAPADLILKGVLNDSGFINAATANYVHSELLGMFGDELFFWRSGNAAEVDFIIQFGVDLIPVEIKPGKVGRTRSLGEYRKRYGPAYAIKASMNNFEDGSVSNIPLYMLWKLDFILAWMFSRQTSI
ncbi:MAG: ATP-binding protein [Oscillospiraceae bacterium]|nr:ATP-binding protein [Oscillospiraceae bacterium]